MGEAKRIAAADKKPEDFAPPDLPPIQKKVAQIVVTRASGETETITLIVRPGDVVKLDGQTILEG